MVGPFQYYIDWLMVFALYVWGKLYKTGPSPLKVTVNMMCAVCDLPCHVLFIFISPEEAMVLPYYIDVSLVFVPCLHHSEKDI